MLAAYHQKQHIVNFLLESAVYVEEHKRFRATLQHLSELLEQEELTRCSDELDRFRDALRDPGVIRPEAGLADLALADLARRVDRERDLDPPRGVGSPHSDVLIR